MQTCNGCEHLCQNGSRLVGIVRFCTNPLNEENPRVGHVDANAPACDRFQRSSQNDCARPPTTS